MKKVFYEISCDQCKRGIHHYCDKNPCLMILRKSGIFTASKSRNVNKHYCEECLNNPNSDIESLHKEGWTFHYPFKNFKK